MSSVSCYPPTCKESLLILFELREGDLYLGEGFEWCAFTVAPHNLNFPSVEAASKNTLTGVSLKPDPKAYPRIRASQKPVCLSDAIVLSIKCFLVVEAEESS